jgi:ribosome recycling factor
MSLLLCKRTITRLHIQLHGRYSSAIFDRIHIPSTHTHLTGLQSQQSQQSQQSRQFSSKSKSKSIPKPTSSLIPGSQQILSCDSSRAEYAKAQERMQDIIAWFRRECAAIETRASGRVTSALLDPVRVALPQSQSHSQNQNQNQNGPPVKVKLEQLATVGVRDGSMLLISVFQEEASRPRPLP